METNVGFVPLYKQLLTTVTLTVLKMMQIIENIGDLIEKIKEVYNNLITFFIALFSSIAAIKKFSKKITRIYNVEFTDKNILAENSLSLSFYIKNLIENPQNVSLIIDDKSYGLYEEKTISFKNDITQFIYPLTIDVCLALYYRTKENVFAQITYHKKTKKRKISSTELIKKHREQFIQNFHNSQMKKQEV